MAPSSIDRYQGCLLGLAMGDALGAPHEGGVVERLLWRLIGRTRDGCMRWTDDTRMSLDLADSLLSVGHLSQDDLARRFANSYRWTRGYGPGTARVLKRIRRGEHWRTAGTAIYPQGSFGNGAAMRAAVLALFFTGRLESLVDATRRSAEVTHCHPLGIEGAVLIAVAAHLLLKGSAESDVVAVAASCCASDEFRSRLQRVVRWIESGTRPTAREVASCLGNGMSAPTSCVTALYIAMRHLHQGFDEMMSFVMACKGDVDTIGAMAGSLWGAHNGASGLREIRLEQRAEIEATAARLHAFGNAFGNSFGNAFGNVLA